jgi:hypothetical protein
MKSFREAQLVTVAGADGAALDGIVVHVPSLVKVEVAVFDAERGPVFRIVHPKVLTERAEESEHDEVLHRLIRRAPAGGRVGPRSGPAHGRRGHSRASGTGRRASRRPTGVSPAGRAGEADPGRRRARPS